MYHKSEAFEQLAFNNTSRVAREQMLLNLQQFVAQHSNEQDKIQAAIEATWEARTQLETAREQFLLAKALSQITVGQYLYNAQGPLNAWFGAIAGNANDTMTAASEADKVAGVNSVMDLIPKPDTSTTKPAPSGLLDLLKQIKGK